jgi:hypothetical protein
MNKKIDNLLTLKGLTKESLPKYFENHGLSIDKLEDISRKDLLNVLEEISRSVSFINGHRLKDILLEFGFDNKLSSGENDLFRDIFHQKKSKLTAVIEGSKTADYESLMRKIDRLSEKVEANNGEGNIESIKKTIKELSIESRNLAAPIRMPAPKDMEVRLVSSDSIHRLTEYNSDINIFLSFTCVFLGAFLGLAGNIISNTSTSGQVYAFTLLVLAVSFIFYGLFKRVSDKQKDLQKTFLKIDTDVNEYDA